MKLLDIINFSEEYLKKYSFSKPRFEGEKVICYILGIKRVQLYTNFEMVLEKNEKEKIKLFLREMTRNRKTFNEILEEKKEKIENLKKEIIIEDKSYRDENINLFSKSIGYLKKNGVLNARIDVEYIFSYVLGIKRGSLILEFDKEINEDNKKLLRKYLIRRGKNREPLQYILKEWEFYGYPIKIDKRTLIPRADTEILVEQCINILNGIENPKILEIGTGSGAISIALAKKIKNSSVLAVDISEEALSLAVQNRELNDVSNLKFLKSDVFKNVREQNYDLIVSNPPYIPINEYLELMPEVKNYEPKIALTDSDDGYYFYRKISRESEEYLKKGGYLAFEVGYNQGEEVSNIMEKDGFHIVGRIEDYGGIERVVIGRKEENKNVNKINGL